MASNQHPQTSPTAGLAAKKTAKTTKSKSRSRDKDVLATKRRCVSTACIACRRRKSKCDGNSPSCAACASVYGTECVYDPNSDHRRKGVYKKDIDNLKTRNSTLQVLVQGILNYPEDKVMDLVKDIRTCESLEDVAEQILAREMEINGDDEEGFTDPSDTERDENVEPKFEKELAGKMGGLRLENGSMQFLGGTSNLLYTELDSVDEKSVVARPGVEQYATREDAIRSWTTVTDDVELIIHLLNMYFTWHYTYFTTLSKYKFFQSFWKGKLFHDRRKTEYCTSLLVNAMLALGCHFTSWLGARANPHDSSTAGDHFFREAKRLIVENDEYEHARLATVQAFALMSVREAGCGREAKGWVYSGMSFRMASDLGLNIDTETFGLDEHEVDARRITFWGCFLFDKCWSNYLGRTPQFPMTSITVPKFDVFPEEDADTWSAWTDKGLDQTHSQPSRTRAVALQISALCEISNDLILTFYHPSQSSKPVGKQAEVKRLSDFHTRLEAWRRALSKEMEPKEGQLPNVLVMHMFHQLLFIHLFRPFLRYHNSNSLLPAHVSPRKICTQAAAMISKILRLYKRTYGLKQIPNLVVYIAHSACTIHLLNLPEKDARRDIIYGVRQLEEIAEMWLCARRTMILLAVQVRKWGIDLPEDASAVLSKAELKYASSVSSPSSRSENTFSGPESPIPQMNGRTAERRVRAASPVPNITSNPAASNMTISARRQHATAQAPQPYNAVEVLQLSSGTASHDESPSNVFRGPENPFVDSKDWWLKDQSALFDNWSRRDSVSMAMPDDEDLPGVNGIMPSLGSMQGLDQSDLAMFSLNGTSHMTGNEGMEGMVDPQSMNGMGLSQGQNLAKADSGNGNPYTDFGLGTTYGYSNGNVY